MNRHPLHFDREYARHTEFGQPLVNSALTLAVVTGMSVADVSQQAIANLGWTDIRMPAPVFNGDTLYAESEVLEKRESRSRPTQGIVTIATRAYKADGTLVMEFRRTMLVPKRGHSVEDRIEAAKTRHGVRADGRRARSSGCTRTDRMRNRIGSSVRSRSEVDERCRT